MRGMAVVIIGASLGFALVAIISMIGVLHRIAEAIERLSEHHL